MELSREAYWLLVLLSRFSHVRPHRRQPTRLHCLWDSPGKNTGVGCHFLLQCMKVKSESEVMSDSLRPQGLQPTRLLCPWDFPGKSTGVGCHCLLQSILEWLPFSSSGDPLDPGIKPESPVSHALQVDSLPLCYREAPYIYKPEPNFRQSFQE